MTHCYKLCGHNIVLDVASGAVHSVDDVTYDVIQMYELILDGKKQDVLIARVMEMHPDIAESDVRAILDDIEKLIDKGKLFSQDTFEELAQPDPDADMPVKALCLNVSHMCNMSCAYCFAARQLQHPEPLPLSHSTPHSGGSQSEALHHTPNLLMSFDTGRQAVDFLIENSKTRKTLDIDFFGGEPLLNWQTVKDIVAYARIAEKMTDKKIRFTLTTNGLLIDDDVIAFTNKEFHNVVLSLDGRPEIHDAMRKLPDGTGSYSEVLPKIKKLVEARRGKGYYIRGTFTRKNIDFVNDILHLAGQGFTELSLEPAVPKRGDPPAFTKADLPELFRQYDILANEMQRRKQMTQYVRPSDIPPENKMFRFYHFNLDLENGPCVYKRIAGCGVGTEYLAVTPGGELYPCHQFIGDEAFLMGDVRQGITNRDLRKKFAGTNIYSKSECKTCWARFYCSGGCAANAYHATGSISGIFDIGCELFKKRIENAIMLQF